MTRGPGLRAGVKASGWSILVRVKRIQWRTHKNASAPITCPTWPESHCSFWHHQVLFPFRDYLVIITPLNHPSAHQLTAQQGTGLHHLGSDVTGIFHDCELPPSTQRLLWPDEAKADVEMDVLQACMQHPTRFYVPVQPL